MRTRVSSLCLIGLMMAGTFAACGSGGGSSSSGSSGGGTITGNDLTIGDIGTYSGRFASSFGGVVPALEAWASTVNAAGGINGHHVRVISKDVGTTTGAGLVAVKELIDQDHVVAIVGDFDPSDATWVPYAASKGVAVVGGLAGTTFLKDADTFSVSGSALALEYGQMNYAKSIGPKIGLVACNDAAFCQQYAQLYQIFAKSISLNIAVTPQTASTAADFTAACQTLKDAGVNTYLIIGATDLGSRVIDACFQQGLQVGAIILTPQNALPSWKTDPAFDGAIGISGVAPFFDTSIAGIGQYRQALQKYSPNVLGSSNDNPQTVVAWASGQLFAAAVKQVSGDVTADSLKSALYKLKNESLNGIVAPMTYIQGIATPANCYFVWTISKGQYVSKGSQPTCAPDAVIAPILAQITK